MRGIDLNRIAFVEAVLCPNEARLAEDPATDIPPPDGVDAHSALYTSMLEQQTRIARRFDYYQDIVVLSILLPSGVVHIRARDDGQAVRELWQLTINGHISGLAGWRMDSFMPTLVYKSFQYGVQVPDMFRQDLTRIFSSAEGFLHVDGIYGQGNRPPYRQIPELADIVSQCGIDLPTPHPILTPTHYQKMTEAEWAEFGFSSMENRLRAMRCLVERYYS